MNPVSHLYIHLPFCMSRCGYCDFYSTTGKLDLAPAYVEGLIGELGSYALPAASLETVYLGGGTPVMLGASQLRKLLAAVREKTASGAEITVEANPSQLTPLLAASLIGSGATRVSLGVQSFDRRLRQVLGRAGSGAAAAVAAQVLRGAGFDNIGMDFIFGIPGQSVASIKKDLKRALAMAPEHISCYELSMKEGSAFKRRWVRQLPAEDECAQMYEAAIEILEEAGYRWYETSNFALPGRECRHNLAYWSGADYIGLGAGAWSTIGRKRWRNAEDVESYIGQGRAQGRGREFNQGRRFEVLTQEQKEAERVFLGLRREVGVDLAGSGEAVDFVQLNILQQNGFLQTLDGKICLTRAGRFVANDVCARLLQSWDRAGAG